MYAYMSSEVHNYEELLSFIANSKNRKPMPVEIIHTVELQGEELQNFLADFKTDQEWLIAHTIQMSTVIGGVWKCIRVASPQLKTPIIVYSNRCLYPQYVGTLQ